jgi:hypothetical protein
MAAKGTVAACSNDTVGGRWKVVCCQPTAYSAKDPPVVIISWNEATRSPDLNSQTAEPTLWTMPAISSPLLKPSFMP